MTPDAAVLDHVTLTVGDLDRAARFYDAVLAPLGWQRIDELVDEEEDDAVPEALSWGPPGGPASLWVVQGSQRTPGSPSATTVHVSLRAPSAAAVTAFAEAAPRHGGAVKDAPRRWALYRRGRFSAMVRDPEGTVVEAVAAEAGSG